MDVPDHLDRDAGEQVAQQALLVGGDRDDHVGGAVGGELGLAHRLRLGEHGGVPRQLRLAAHAQEVHVDRVDDDPRPRRERPHDRDDPRGQGMEGDHDHVEPAAHQRTQVAAVVGRAHLDAGGAQSRRGRLEPTRAQRSDRGVVAARPHRERHLVRPSVAGAAVGIGDVGEHERHRPAGRLRRGGGDRELVAARRLVARVEGDGGRGGCRRLAGAEGVQRHREVVPRLGGAGRGLDRAAEERDRGRAVAAGERGLALRDQVASLAGGGHAASRSPRAEVAAVPGDRAAQALVQAVGRRPAEPLAGLARPTGTGGRSRATASPRMSGSRSGRPHAREHAAGHRRRRQLQLVRVVPGLAGDRRARGRARPGAM